MADLTTRVASLVLKNPLILASGILDMARETINKMTHAGGIVTKSVGLKERTGHPNPTIVELDHGLLNAMGLANPGVSEYLPEISGVNKKQVLIGSIYGKTKEDFAQVATHLQPHVSALELNMSCPHVKDYGMDVSCAIAEITAHVKHTVTLPVFVKLGMENILDNARAAQKGNADGIVAINTLPAMAIDIETQMPILGNKTGGYSGPAIKPIGVRCIYHLSQHLDLPLIGVGGILTAADVLEYLMAGASAVQIGTAFYYGDDTLFSALCRHLEGWMESHGFSTLDEVVARAHHHR